MAHVPLQLARIAGAPGRPVHPDRPHGVLPTGAAPTGAVPPPGAPQPVAVRPAPLPRPGLLALARTSLQEAVRWARVRRALRLHRRRPA